MTKDDEKQRDIFRARQTLYIENLRMANEYRQSALKSAMLINGGAAVALLALAGSISSESVSGLIDLVEVIYYFTFGVLFAALGILMSHFHINKSFEIHQKVDATGGNKNVVGLSTIVGTNDPNYKTLRNYERSTYACIYVSFAIFIMGIIFSIDAFITIISSVPALNS